MKTTLGSTLALCAAVAAAMMAPAKAEANTRYVAHATIAAPVAVRVWVDGGDMFPDYNHVTLWLRSDRDCYSSLFLVDTAGFIHVLNAHDGWLYGGRTYGYRACDLGLDRLDGRGIAYVFAVGSPVPFDYSSYGDGVCVDGFGYRVVGDPFFACREFSMSILPASCQWDCVGVSFTRFYVREWARYPAYLCAGGPYHVRVGDNCRACSEVYATYRTNVAAPYDAMRPVVRYKSNYTATAHIVRFNQWHSRDAYAPIEPARTPFVVKETGRMKSHDMTRVVSTSREIARAPQFQPDRPAYMPAIARSAARGNGQQIVAYKGRGESRDANANAREKGTHKKVREAE
ncbi:MAG TPA: hypothetical protein VJS69_12595 [Candidatus Krumholzibacteria bacterium]|nr:hypothetical protein [Candidatus Krumholzibacteria bacterium]